METATRQSHQPPEWTAAELLSLARWQQFFIGLCLLVCLNSSPLIVAVTIVQSYLFFRLALAVRSPAPWFAAIFGAVPGVNLFVLVSLNHKITVILRSAGIRVGLVGANAYDLRQLKDLVEDETTDLQSMLPDEDVQKIERIIKAAQPSWRLLLAVLFFPYGFFLAARQAFRLLQWGRLAHKYRYLLTTNADIENTCRDFRKIPGRLLVAIHVGLIGAAAPIFLLIGNWYLSKYIATLNHHAHAQSIKKQAVLSSQKAIDRPDNAFYAFHAADGDHQTVAKLFGFKVDGTILPSVESWHDELRVVLLKKNGKKTKPVAISIFDKESQTLLKSLNELRRQFELKKQPHPTLRNTPDSRQGKPLSHQINFPHSSAETNRLIQGVLTELTQNDEVFWVGIYLQDSKVGYGSLTTRYLRHAEPPVLQEQATLMMQTRHNNQVIEMTLVTESLFNPAPPYELRFLVEEQRQQDDIQRIEVTHTGERAEYSATIMQGGIQRNHLFRANYTLADEWAAALWLRQSPQEGDLLFSHSLDTTRFEIVTDKSLIKEKKTGIFNGVQTTYYLTETTLHDGTAMEGLILMDGTIIKADFAGIFELRLEPETVAKNLASPQDLFIENLVAVEGSIGDPRNVNRLVLDVNPELGQALENAPGQKVVSQPATNTFRITLTRDHVADIRVTGEERAQSLKSTVDIPAAEPQIKELADKAIEGADGPQEQVKYLVQFVSQYIDDNYSAEPLTVLDTVRKREGDCSEHASLFTTLARAAGIPARTVGGLVFAEVLEDKYRFGAHAWNEVDLNGYWVPVDPTWNETTINATHIRFPVEKGAELQAFSNLANAKIRVIEVNRDTK